PSNVSSNSSLYPQLEECLNPEIMSIMSSLLVVYVLVMPLFIYVLVVGYQQWRKEGFSSTCTTWSHSDIFTYNVLVLDLLNILGSFFFVFGVLTEKPGVMKAGSIMFGIFIPGQTLFHLLTCMERYLAVVHPIFYLRLKGSAGIRIRNITVGCVWLISIVVMIATMQFDVSVAIINGLLLSFTSVAFIFCSVSVLSALIRPAPGKGGRTRERADQSRQRAFRTIIIITGTLFLRFMSSLITSI
ncbi:hypothetical protein GOODEAATRI_033195, partial [Goodea atripinnis]